MLIDEVEVAFKAGNGGSGKVSFYPGKTAGPDGGNGGKGGDIYVLATSDLTALNQFSHQKFIRAENGQSGQGNRKTGKDGRFLEVKIPVGCALIDKDNGEVINLEDLSARIRVCKGGLGGKGNFELKSSRNTTPMRAQPGLPGQERHFLVVLRLIADFGLVGLPNAGKSSLLNAITAARAKVANYAFTTLEPNLGVLNDKVIADIPGLIEGASSGRGLGVKFLKHIEKVEALIHCISAESEDPISDYQVVKEEMGQYNLELLQKREIIVLTKSDLLDQETLHKRINLLKKHHFKEVIPLSIYHQGSLNNLMQVIKQK